MDAVSERIEGCNKERATRSDVRDLTIAIDFWHKVTQYNTNGGASYLVLNAKTDLFEQHRDAVVQNVP